VAHRTVAAAAAVEGENFGRGRESSVWGRQERCGGGGARTDLAEQSDGVRALRESSGERRRESRRAGRARRRAGGFGDFRVPVAFHFLVSDFSVGGSGK
jgi:hypothetical protein